MKRNNCNQVNLDIQNPEGKDRKKLPVLFQKLTKLEKGKNTVRLIDCDFYQGKLFVQNFYKPISKI